VQREQRPARDRQPEREDDQTVQLVSSSAGAAAHLCGQEPMQPVELFARSRSSSNTGMTTSST